jgi:6,7-dimethyl-8-ribityllumazine synthase
MATRAPEVLPDATGLRLAVVTGLFNHEVTGAMRRRALEETKRLGGKVTHDVTVPGAYDLPLVADRLLARDDVDAVVVLGAVVTGETGHDALIAHAAAQRLAALAVARGKPIGLGVTGPAQTQEQAVARIDRAEAAVRSAVHQVRTLEGLGRS